MEAFNKIGVIGVGLLGGSIGLAVKSRFPKTTVVGMGRNEEKLQKALDLKAIDSYTLNIKEGVQDCDLVIISTPISKIVPICFDILPFIKPDAIITDVGSTKYSITKAIEENITAKKHYIGSHPMAGSDQSGVEFSLADLYLNSTVIVTQGDNTPDRLINRISKFWESLDAKVLVMAAEKHDKVIAFTSHLPHILASSLAYTLSNCMTAEEKKANLLGNGLLDTTRIAKGDPKMWLDILLSNKKNILNSISMLKETLTFIEDSIHNNNISDIDYFLKKGKQFRDELSNFE